MKDLHPRKPIRFWASSHADLRELPDHLQNDAGYDIDRLQSGREPYSKWETRPDLGSGVLQITVGKRPTYRVMVVAKFAEVVYVLHVFEKRTRKTSDQDNEITRKRYREILEFRKQQGYK